MATPELLHNLNALTRRIETLMEQQSRLLTRVSELEKQNLILMAEHKNDLQELQKAKKEIEFLTLSHRLADTPEALVSVRNHVAKLIRTVDSCIRMIKED